jgi:hypothetical protein
MSRSISSNPLASGLLACTFAALFAFPWGPIQDRCIGIDVGQPSLVSECASYVVTSATGSSELNWKDNPAIMDSSWQAWPTLTDF